MKKKKVAVLSILIGIILLIIWIISPIFVDERGKNPIIVFLIYISAFMLIGLGAGYLSKIKHLKNI